MFTVMEPEAQAEMYRNTPFEHVTTAEAGQILLTCATPVQVVQGWTAKAGFVRVGTQLPHWLGGYPNTPSLAPAVESIVEKLDWLSTILGQVQFEMLEDAADIEAASKALANPKNAVRVPLNKVKKRLGL